MERVVARAFWRPRPQSVDGGAAAIVATLRGLGDLDAGRLGRWFDPGKSRRDVLRREIAADPDVIRAFVSRNHAGHFLPPAESRQPGVDAFAAGDISFADPYAGE